MKLFLIFTFILIFPYLITFRKVKMNWLDRSFTQAIKGFSILTIIWAHAGAKLGIGGIQFIAGIGVALFLICSGYGLEESYKKNGLKRFWHKRLFQVCIPFWIVELLGLVIAGSFSLKSYILDFFFIEAATSYGWFMGYLMVCYIIFFLLKKISEKFLWNKKLN